MNKSFGKAGHIPAGYHWVPWRFQVLFWHCCCGVCACNRDHPLARGCAVCSVPHTPHRPAQGDRRDSEFIVEMTINGEGVDFDSWLAEKLDALGLESEVRYTCTTVVVRRYMQNGVLLKQSTCWVYSSIMLLSSRPPVNLTLTLLRNTRGRPLLPRREHTPEVMLARC